MVWTRIQVLISILFCLPIDGKKEERCGPGTKPVNSSSMSPPCTALNNWDVLSSIHFITNPPAARCKSTVTSQGMEVCEDALLLPVSGANVAQVSPQSKYKPCYVLSLISTNYCDELGSLEFERYWSQYCTVEVRHMITYFKTSQCPQAEFPSSLRVIRQELWGSKCYNCFYKSLSEASTPSTVDILKIGRASVGSVDLDGSQYTVLADLYLHTPWLISRVTQVLYTASLSSYALIDNVGRESEHAWNIFASSRALQPFGVFSAILEAGPETLQPRQFENLLSRVRLRTDVAFYHLSLLRIDDPLTLSIHAETLARWKPQSVDDLEAQLPPYCSYPSPSLGEKEQMQKWISEELLVRCHPFRLWVPCVFSRPYDAFIPCRQELMNHLAEDYAATKNWCDFNHDAAAVPHLQVVDAEASRAFQATTVTLTSGGKSAPATVRLAFLLTVYSDAPYVKRVLEKLYSPHHYYLLHVDPAGSKPAFTTELREEIKLNYEKHHNVFLSHDVPIVYGASTATVVLTKAMAWFLRETSGWDFFVCVTGSDYPLLPLLRFENILQSQLSAPRPFVMAWTPGTSTHIFRLQKTHPVFEENPLLVKSIDAVFDERGKPLGAVPMEYRSNNFGPPLFCSGQKSFYHLDNRRNKSATRLDTQWLFPRDVYRGKGRAYANENRAFASPSADGHWRVWKKSDPATTAVYDRESVQYIVESEEGRKYWHFFKHMLLGSEEHYYVSLLYNWPRTRAFVQTLSAQMVWNTWKKGLWESAGGFQTHTHFLSAAEMELIQGFAMRGMMFARKFSSKKTSELLDAIDAYIHFNSSSDAGLYWPGYFETDTWTPGKEWVAALRRNETLKLNRLKKQFSTPNDMSVKRPGANSNIQILDPRPRAGGGRGGGGRGGGGRGGGRGGGERGGERGGGRMDRK